MDKKRISEMDVPPVGQFYSHNFTYQQFLFNLTISSVCLMLHFRLKHHCCFVDYMLYLSKLIYILKAGVHSIMCEI